MQRPRRTWAGGRTLLQKACKHGETKRGVCDSAWSYPSTLDTAAAGEKEASSRTEDVRERVELPQCSRRPAALAAMTEAYAARQADRTLVERGGAGATRLKE